MKQTCPICKNEYDDGGESWKTKCYPCWKYYKHSKRIDQITTHGYFNLYVTHPSVTKEELDQWIKNKKEGAGGWGVEEINLERYKEKFRVWQDYTNFD